MKKRLQLMSLKYVIIALALFCFNASFSDLNAEVSQKQSLVSIPDPNFHIYICFGQSNMEGNAAIGVADRTKLNPRFRMLAVCDGVYSGQQRYASNWYTALPPLCRQDTGLTPADYFGRVLTDSLPDSIRVGVVMVAIGGAGIDAFDKDNYKTYYSNSDAWQKSLMDIYGGNPYAKLIEMAKKAQKVGVIKGILLHQGESNNGQTDWPAKVKKIYDNMTTDLTLNPDSVPLLAGEMRYQDQGGICWGMNSIIENLPHTIKNCYVISANGCLGNTVDGFHFSTEGARELGKRYGRQMYSLIKKYNTVDGRTVDHLQLDFSKCLLLTGSFQKIPLMAIYKDGHSKSISNIAIYSVVDSTVAKVNNGYIEAYKDGETEITASYIDEENHKNNISFGVQSSSFPLTSEFFNPSIYGSGSFDENTLSLTTSSYGFGGWQYSNGLDLSGYKYLVVRLASQQSCNATFRIFDENSYWTASSDTQFGNGIKAVIDLKNMKKTVDNKLVSCDLSHIYLMGFWSNGNSPIKIKDIYLSNDGINPVTTDMRQVLFVKKNQCNNVFTLGGMRIFQGKQRDIIGNLSKGLYIIDGKCVSIK
jgi:hypothetical protein